MDIKGILVRLISNYLSGPQIGSYIIPMSTWYLPWYPREMFVYTSLVACKFHLENMRNVLGLNSTFTLGVSLHSPKTIPRPSMNVVGTFFLIHSHMGNG